MAFDLILRNGALVTPQGILAGDLGVTNGKIAAIGKIAEKGTAERNVAGLHILPGVIDMHVHFRDPGFPEKEDFGTGSFAAASGGVTTVIDMPNTNPPVLTCEALEEKRRIAAQKSLVNYGFYFGLSLHNLEEIKKAKGLAGVKVYMSSAEGDLLIQDLNIIEQLFSLGKFVIVHAEENKIILEALKKNKDSQDPSAHSLIRNATAAYEATKAVLHLAKKLNARVHITHVSTAQEVDELRKFKSPLVTADVTPHHLYLTQSAYSERGNFVKVNPPLRTNKDRQELWKGLREGVIQAIATDHAPHTRAEKERPYNEAPAGVPGLETMLPLLLDSVNHGEITLQDVARFTSENPARILNLKSKGRIEVGADADLAIIDINASQEVGAKPFYTKCGWSPFSGWKPKGWPAMTIVGGEVVFENGAIASQKRGVEISVL